jgi:hypothetical protein
MSNTEPVAAGPGRSRACAGSEHQVCGHVCFAVPPVRRRESTIVLCRCSCHRACPLARRKAPVPVTIWQMRCSCPGAEEARTSQGDPREALPTGDDYWETYKSEQRLRSEARKEAFKATRAAVAGKTRDEIRDLYIAELAARGLEIPREPLLEANIDMLCGDPLAGFGRIWKMVLHVLR